jgi:hypothetical protein
MYLLSFLAVAQAQPLVAVVIIDQEARDHGYALELDGLLVHDALPIDVVEGEVVSVVDPLGQVAPLGVAMGEAWEVTGPQGEAWMSILDEDVRTDMIAVRGHRRAVARLAEALGAEVTERDGISYLSARDVLYDAPWVEDIDLARIEELSYVRVDEVIPSTRTLPTRHRPVRRVEAQTVLAAAATARTAVQSAEAVGLLKATEVTQSGETSTPEQPSEAELALVQQRLDRLELLDRLDADRERYAGLHLCRDSMLFLHPSGIYQLAGDQGEWRVGAPGVVRMFGPNGELWYRAAIEADRSYCRDVWTDSAALNAGTEPTQSKRRRK